jgi:hypothetical protein
MTTRSSRAVRSSRGSFTRRSRRAERSSIDTSPTTKRSRCASPHCRTPGAEVELASLLDDLRNGRRIEI